ncbi:hypothetical protein QZH41_014007 [Actinostola sp. cb2023]|nr:hypothetical protein QZH41_014007 [Actinostola sp. cb2023]
MVAMGVLGKKGYMQDPWNRLDFIIIAVGIVEKLMEGSDYLTIIRAFRVLRPLRAINKVPSIRILVTLLLDTLPMLGNVLLLSFLIFFVFGIIGVQLWQGHLRNRCFIDLPVNMTLPLRLNKSLFYQPSFDKPDFICSLPQDSGMATCDDIPPYYYNRKACTQSPTGLYNRTANSSDCVDWNQLYITCRREGPNPFYGTTSFDNIAIAWIAIFQLTFSPCYTLASLLLLQVITLEGWSEIMYLVQDSHSFWNWIYFVILVVIGAFFLVNLCLVVITMQFQETKAREIELIEENRRRQGGDNEAYQPSINEERPRTMASRKDDDMYDSIFDLRQCDSYDVVQKHGPCNRLSIVGRRVAESKYFVHFIMISILVNMICMGLEHHNQPEELTIALEKSNIIFVTIFSVEMTINLVAYGLAEYLSQAQNVFDGFVVVMSVAELLVNEDYARLSVFRSIRLLRIFKLVRPVRYQLLIVIRTMNSVVTFFGLLFLFMFAFSILGMNLFGGKFIFLNADNERVVRRSNFDTFLWAMVTVFQTNKTTQRDENKRSNIETQPKDSLKQGNNIRLKKCQLKTTKPKILVNGDSCGEDCYEPASRQPTVEYCGHAVRNALWSNPPPKPPTDSRANKPMSLSKRIKKRLSGTSDIFDDITDVDLHDHFLTMPELKRKRQTSIAIIRKTCMQPGSRVITGRAKWNPSYVPDDETDETSDRASASDMAIVLQKKLPQENDHRIFEPKKPSLKRIACPVQSFSGGKYPIELRVTDEATTMDVIPQIRPSICHASREVRDIRNIEDILTICESNESDGTLQVRTQPTLTNDIHLPGHAHTSDISQDMSDNKGDSKRWLGGCFSTRSDWSLFLFSPDNRFRLSMVTICRHKVFDYVILVFILLSCVVLAMEGPGIEKHIVIRQIIDISMFLFTIVFTIEMMMKVVAMGFMIGVETYLKDGWNKLDFVLVLLSWLDVVITYTPQASVDVLGTLKVFRALRTLRPLRMIRRAPGLKLVVQTLLYSLKPIGNTVLIAAIFFAMFGILGVQLFKGKLFYCEGDSHVVNRTQCLNSTRGRWINRRYNFDNLLQALISLFVVSTRDGWVEVMHHGIDAVDVDRQPIINYAEWCLVYFIPFLLLGGFLVLNMIVGVVVENFQRCREQLDEEERNFKKKEQKKPKSKKPQDDSVDYFVQFNVLRRYIHFVCMHQYWDITIAVIICINVICMSLEHYQMSEAFIIFVETTNYFFTAVFVVEVVLKVVALGWIRYVKDRWNIIDLIIVLLSVSGILLTDLVKKDLLINPTVIRTLRVLRIVRVLKLVKLAKGVRSLLDTLFEALPQVANLGLLFLLLFFIYSCLGIQLFGSLECSHAYPCQGLGGHANFNNFGSAMLTLFRIATGDNWNGILKDTLRSQCDGSADCSKNCCISKYTAPLYFVTFVLSAQFVLVNVVIAVLMKHLKESKEKLAATLAAKNLEKRLKLLTLIAKNFIRSKATRKPTPSITRRRSVVELGLGGIELAQLKNHKKKWMNESFYQDVVKADAIFQQFIQLNNSLRSAKLKALRTSSNGLDRVASAYGSRKIPEVKRRHTLVGIWDLKSQDPSPTCNRVIWKSGCSPL